MPDCPVCDELQRDLEEKIRDYAGKCEQRDDAAKGGNLAMFTQLDSEIAAADAARHAVRKAIIDHERTHK